MANGFFSATGDIMKGLADAAAKKRDELVSSAETRLKIDSLLNALALKVYEGYVTGEVKDPNLQATCQNIQLKQWEIDEKWAEINRVKSNNT